MPCSTSMLLSESASATVAGKSNRGRGWARAPGGGPIGAIRKRRGRGGKGGVVHGVVGWNFPPVNSATHCFIPAAGRVAEWIRSLELAAALLHCRKDRLLLSVQAICSLRSDRAAAASGDSLIVSNPRRSQSMAPEYNRQWLRPRHQLAQARRRQTMLLAQHLQCVPAPLLKTSAPERTSQPQLSFSFDYPRQPRTKTITLGAFRRCDT